jgi:hypothetical protein
MSVPEEEWQPVYRSLDSAALLILLSVLQEESKRWRRELETVSSSRESDDATSAYVNESAGEALAALDARLSADDEGRALFEELRDEMRGQLDELHRRDQEGRERTTEYEMKVFQHAIDHLKRERWAREELQRRGLLPSFPAISP